MKLGNQLQEKNWKKHKYVEAKQHATKQQWVNKEIKEKIKKNTWKQHGNTMVQNLQDVSKAILRRNFKAL